MAPLIVTAVIGLGIGIWLGMPGRYSQDADEIEHMMASGDIPERKRRKRLSPLAWLQRRASATAGPSRQRRRGTGRSGFKLEAPEDR